MGKLAIDSGLRQSVDVSTVFEKAVREKKYDWSFSSTISIHIRKLESFYKANSQKVSVIVPTYQWADGLEEVGFSDEL